MVEFDEKAAQNDKGKRYFMVGAFPYARKGIYVFKVLRFHDSV